MRFDGPIFRQITGSLVFHLLLAVAVGLIGWLAARHSLDLDWSAVARNSLTESSRMVLDRLEAPLRISSFTPDDPQLRARISAVIAPYLRHPGGRVRFEFINPDTQPELARQLQIRATGELHFEYRDSSRNLRDINEQSISNTIQQLLQRGERWIVFVAGHGERGADSPANHGMAAFTRELRDKGYLIQTLSLAEAGQFPDNAGLVVIAGPEVDFLPAEAQRVVEYLERGGNLLWLLEPEGLRGLGKVALQLGLRPLPGTVVDPGGARLGIDNPGIALVPRYPDHPVTGGFELLTVYPYAAALQVDLVDGWEPTPLLQTLSGSWNETDTLQGAVGYDPQSEQAGPLTLGYAMARNRGPGGQRVVVIGDGDFLSNAYLGNGGNLDLGLNLIRWLSGDEQMLQIPARSAPDRTLQLSTARGAMIAGLFVVLLPLLLLFVGLLIAWRRRRR